jgi:hypothetical protein
MAPVVIAQKSLHKLDSTKKPPNSVFPVPPPEHALHPLHVDRLAAMYAVSKAQLDFVRFVELQALSRATLKINIKALAFM